jgi:hypothetical protein
MIMMPTTARYAMMIGDTKAPKFNKLSVSLTRSTAVFAPSWS